MSRLKSNHTLKKLIAYLASLSFGIYLTNQIVLDILNYWFNLEVHYVTGNIAWFYTWKTILLYISSAIITAALLKIPKLNYLLGTKFNSNKL